MIKEIEKYTEKLLEEIKHVDENGGKRIINDYKLSKICLLFNCLK